ncbi:MAG TPA: 2-dehydropantoate 2-reductase N-terminal domain-containing protein [Pyrinomonadaceae bacterium]|nr:2-dehydropantoate 2-reductase N-terminal domain-containing protein [Pyrinomonadaceae bacterium]
MKIFIIGAGAIGKTLAVALKLSDKNVVLVREALTTVRVRSKKLKSSRTTAPNSKRRLKSAPSAAFPPSTASLF